MIVITWTRRQAITFSMRITTDSSMTMFTLMVTHAWFGGGQGRYCHHADRDGLEHRPHDRGKRLGTPLTW